MTDPRYPDIDVQLTGEDGNTGAIMGRVARALRSAGVPSAEVDRMRMEMLSGDYANVLSTAERWVNVS